MMGQYIFDCCSVWLELSSLFYGCEGLLDWIEIGAIAREWQDDMACFWYDLLNLFFVMKSGVIHHNDAWLAQLRQQHFLNSLIDGFGVATAFEQHGSQPFVLALRHYKIGGFAVIAVYPAKDFPPSSCPTMWSVALWGKTAFIEINDILRTIFLRQPA